MNRAAVALAAFAVIVRCQQPLPQYGDSGPAQAAPTGFMPMNAADERRQSVNANAASPETSSVQSRDYSGSNSDFYGYNYPASYGPPSSSYGSSGEWAGWGWARCNAKSQGFQNGRNEVKMALCENARFKCRA